MWIFHIFFIFFEIYPLARHIYLLYNNLDLINVMGHTQINNIA